MFFLTAVTRNLVIARFLCEYSGTYGILRGGTPIRYLYGYMPPNGVVILKLLI